MHKSYISGLFGLTTVLSLSQVTLPTQAQQVVYLETSGIASLQLEESTLNVLESIGLSLNSFTNTAEPFPGFELAALMLPPSNDPDVRGSTFTFTFDNDSGQYIPLSGTEEFTGSFLFDVDTSQLNLPSQLEIGEFSNAFDENFQFSLTDTLTTQLPVFDIDLEEIIIDVNTEMITLDVNLDISQEFSDFLAEAGATQSVAGLRFSQNLETRTFIPLSAATVPEPTNVLGVLLTTLFAAYLKRSKTG